MELRSSATGLNSNSGLRMDSALNIAVISDTHDNVPENLISAIESADEIWHLGDICQLESLQRLRSLGPEFLSVQGNCDPYEQSPHSLVLERFGIRFRLQHRPPQTPDSSVDVVLFGHLHYPVKRKTDFGHELKPGAVNGSRDGSQSSFAWLSFASKGVWNWKLAETGLENSIQTKFA